MRHLTLVLSLLLPLLAPAAVSPCHVAAKLRYADDLTPAQKSLLSHGGIAPEPIAYTLRAPTACQDGSADIFPCRDVDLIANLPLSALGGGTGNDLWGWTDPLTGREYALVGRSTGLAFVDLSVPEAPRYLGDLPTHSVESTWRDVKVYGDHALIVADWAGAHGMQVFDLTQLRTVAAPPVTFAETAHYSGFQRAHNIVVDPDSGFAFAVGGESCAGGLHMIDVRVPTSPTFAGCYAEDGYTHDAQCVTYHGPDTAFAGRQLCFAANEDTVTIVDVENKAAPLQLSRRDYPGRGYVHQGWLSEDHRYFVQDDEVDESVFGHNTKTYLWDVSDLATPTLVATFLADGSSIDHNQYVRGDHTFQANYQRGLRILRLGAGTLEEVAFFDTYPEGDAIGFSGAWSVYPFFASGIVAVSDINRGLFVLQPRLSAPKTIFADGFESGDTAAWSTP